MAVASNNPFPSVLLAEQGSAPATPASGFGRLYVKADGLFFIGDDGVEVGPLGAGGGSGTGNVVNTDGDPGDTIYVGSVDPSVDYAPEVGDVWIQVTA